MRISRMRVRAAAWHEFSEVNALVCRIYKGTKGRTFENVFHALLNLLLPQREFVFKLLASRGHTTSVLVEFVLDLLHLLHAYNALATH